jgi:hypothetical protein
MRHPRLLVLLVAALVLVGAAPAAGMTPPSVKKQPTLLWRTYPLKQRPATPHRPSPRTQLAGTNQAPESRPGGNQALPPTLVWGLLSVAIAALVLLLLLLRPALSIATGGRTLVARRTRARVHPAKPERHQSKPGPEDLLETLRLKLTPMRESEVEKPQQLERGQRAESPPVPLRALRQPESQQEPEPEAITRLTPLPAPAQLEPEPTLPREHQHAKPEAPSERPHTVTAESCEIEFWRGYAKCQLYAASLDRAGAGTGFAFSPFFRLRDEDTPTKEAVGALKTLIDRLERDGWTVVSAGARWYQLRLNRSSWAS